MLEGFEILEFVQGVPSVSFTKNGISFNKAAVEKMKNARYVLPLIDKNGMRFAIAECEAGNEKAMDFLKDPSKISNGVRWNNRDLKRELERITGWSLEQEGFKIVGEYIAEDNALIFAFRNAIPI